MSLYGTGRLTIREKITRTLFGSPEEQAQRRSRDYRYNDLMVNRAFRWTLGERMELYAHWESLYANRIYDRRIRGGFREWVLHYVLGKESTGEQNSLPLHGWYNPVSAITDCYQNCIGGTFGVDFNLAKEVGPEGDRHPINPKVVEPVWRVWQKSKMNVRLPAAQWMAANLGCVGLKVVDPGSDENGDPTQSTSRVPYVVAVDPKEIHDVVTDDRGNVTGAFLRYLQNAAPLGSDAPDWVEYEQEITETHVVTRRGGQEVSAVEHPLGFCPFVLLNHQDAVQQPYGLPAHFGTDQILHQLNWLYSRIGVSVDRHVFPKWFAAASGPAPKTFDLGDSTLAYIQTNPGDTSPKLEALVAKLDYNGILQVINGLRNHLRERQPELVLASLEALSGQSGETITKLLTNTTQRIKAARVRYEDAACRVLQMALSWGVATGAWELGTGEDFDAAYRDGTLDLAFNDRPALPATDFDKQKMAEAANADARLKAQIGKDTATFAGDEQAMRVIGMTEAQIEKAMASKAANALPPATGGPGDAGGGGL